VQQGRIRIRYSDAAKAKTYPAAVRNVAFDADAPVQVAPRPPRGRRPAPSGAPSGDRAGASAPETTSDKVAVCFTDGACRGNPGPSGAGLYIEFPDGRRLRASKSLGPGTNNIAELTGVLMAIEHLEAAGWLPERGARILTDSTYGIGVLQTGWKAKANQELVRAIKRRLAAHAGVRLAKVAGHAGIYGNEEADRLANQGVDGLSVVEWQ